MTTGNLNLQLCFTPRTLAILASLMVLMGQDSMVRAEVTLDGTLGAAGALPGPDYMISADIGKQLGPNLFHSFGKFNVLTGESATFTGPNAVSNIISRVTGGGSSTIDGTLRSQIPGANMYLINHSGILFGENARLDVQGSFHASTADFLRLGEEGRFDVKVPENSVLSVAPPSAFGFVGNIPAPISVQGSILEVPVDQTLSLVGGDIELSKELATSRNLSAPSGRINIASVASSGEVVPNSPDEPPGLKMEGFEELGNIRLTRSVFPDDPDTDWVPNIVTDGDPGGTIVIRGGQLTIDQGAIGSNSSSESTIAHPGVGIDIGVTGYIFLLGEISSVSYGEGRAGDVRIVASRLHVMGGEFPTQSGSRVLYLGNIGSRAFGAGDGGDINITTDSLLVENNAQIGATAEATGSGSGGNLTIQTSDLQILGDQKSAVIHTDTFGTGNSGDLTITADQVLMRGGPGFTGLGAGTGTNVQGLANAGKIRLKVRNLQVLDGAQISAGVDSGAGNGGSIEISADTIVVDGVDADGFQSGIFASSRYFGSAQEPATGDAGDVHITAQTLRLSDQGRIDVFSNSFGSPGDIDIKVDKLEVSDGAFIANSNFGVGEIAGNILIDAGQVSLVGPSPENGSTGIFNLGGVSAPAVGNIQLTTDSLQVLDGAEISGWTVGPGAGGSLTIKADRAVIAGKDIINQVPSRIDARTFIFNNNFVDNATGRGGDIVLQAQTLELRDGGVITTASESAGDGGNLTLVTERLRLTSDAAISAESTHTGNAGSLDITASDRLQSENSTVTTSADQAAGGNINISAGSGSVQLVRSPITASVTRGEGGGGNVTISGKTVAALDNSDITAQADEGFGGNITINAEVFIASADVDIDASSNRLGNEGDVRINSPKVDISGRLAALPSTFLDVSTLLSERCGARERGKVSSFVVLDRGGLPPEPDKLLSATSLDLPENGAFGRVPRPKAELIEGRSWEMATDLLDVHLLQDCQMR